MTLEVTTRIYLTKMTRKPLQSRKTIQWIVLPLDCESFGGSSRQQPLSLEKYVSFI
jgi:hypothetical protein